MKINGTRNALTPNNDMRRWFAKVALWSMFLLALSPAAFAGIECNEKVTALILHSNGEVFFRTDKTCPTSWCQVAFANTAANSKAYALLLTAKAQGKNLVFYWNNLNNCSTQNPVYTSPDYVYMVE